MSSLRSELPMTPYITQGKILSLHHDLPGFTLLLFTTVPVSPITLLLVTPVLLVPLFLSHVKHTPGTLLSQGPGVCSPLLILLPRYSTFRPPPLPKPGFFPIPTPTSDPDPGGHEELLSSWLG